MLKIATCQFPVHANITRNRDYMLKQMKQSAEQGAQLAHFGECALSGYCGPDFESWAGYDWETLRSVTEELLQAAKELNLWLVFGSSHRLTGAHLPHNCVYVVDNHGQLMTRYDKRRCSMRDLNNYTPGDTPITFEISGIKFGVLICLDYRFPELFAEYMNIGVDCVLHSFHDAKKQKQTLATKIAPPTLQGHAGNYVLWLSVANNSTHYQAFNSMFINPMGIVESTAKRHRPDVMLNTIDKAEHGEYMQMVRSFRADARSGKVYQSRQVCDPCSEDRTRLHI